MGKLKTNNVSSVCLIKGQRDGVLALLAHAMIDALATLLQYTVRLEILVQCFIMFYRTTLLFSYVYDIKNSNYSFVKLMSWIESKGLLVIL